jgi:hypothetical protein
VTFWHWIGLWLVVSPFVAVALGRLLEAGRRGE